MLLTNKEVLELHEKTDDVFELAEAIERAVLAKAMQSDATGRSLQDYAIEHAEYMAKSAEQLLNHLNECTNIDDCVIEPDENFSDYTSGLRLSIHDFRKRRDRAKAMPIPKQEPVAVQYRYLDHLSKEWGEWGDKIKGKTGGFETRNLYAEPQPAKAVAVPEWMPIETMPFNTPVLVSDEKIIASMFFYKRKDRGYENSLYPRFMGAGDAEVRVSLYPNGCWSKLKWWRPMPEMPLSAPPKPE